ncbi:RsmB/NOP family class I SAM-dependent RNA methyltransferase [Paracoccus jiaweipingae]|uniref:RsmB/NOP family class I SAM-dependent RNA methyltransferase n=1 Tax=unclassified Paracoccus (in: a-proteobacteria) TaxID=2688777 RepID=UPI00379EBECF
MTPGARIAAAAGVLDAIAAGQPAEQALLRWSRASRFAGSGDRAAVRDLVFDALRQRRSAAALGGGDDGAALMLGLARAQGADIAALFSGQGHALPPPPEDQAGCPPDADQASDMPDWLLGRLRADLGSGFDAIAQAMRQRAPVWLRVNRARADTAQAVAALARDGVSVQASDLSDTALMVLEGARRIAGGQAYRSGLVELQDLSPQLACARLPQADTVLDYCAGGGGKALALAARGARVTAHDVDGARMADLPARAARAGVMIGLARPGRVTGRFGMVLADVPCSGSGTWRRDPAGKWRLTPDRLAQLCQIQAQLLDESVRFLQPGGALAYMTCSLLRCENDDQITAFLNRHADFSLQDQASFGPLRESDGFFMAVLRQKNDAR